MAEKGDDRHLESFLEMMMAERGASPNTEDAYRRDLGQYLDDLSRQGTDALRTSAGQTRRFIEGLAAAASAATEARWPRSRSPTPAT